MITTPSIISEAKITTMLSLSPGKFPKILMKKPADIATMHFVYSSENFSTPLPLWVTENTVVIEPSIFIEDETGNPMTLGVDYNSLILLPRPPELPSHLVISKRIRPPQLTAGGSAMKLQWDSAYRTATSVYRVRLPKPVGNPRLSTFTLIAEVSPSTSSGGLAYYVDTSSTNFFQYAYAYYVVNDNGKSNIVVLEDATTFTSMEW